MREKNPIIQELGRKGGKASSAKLNEWERHQRAKKAARARWKPETFECPNCGESVGGPVNYCGMVKCVWCHTAFEVTEDYTADHGDSVWPK